jgi:hypothetical protein
LLHIQCILLRSTVLMITSHEWVLLQRECGCCTLLGCYIFFKPSLKSWTVGLGLISWLWTMTTACSEWQVSRLADGNHAWKDTKSAWTCPPTSVSEYEGGMTLVVWHREHLQILLFMCVCVCVLNCYDCYCYLFIVMCSCVWILWYRIVIL